MGVYLPRPYKKLNRLTNKFETVLPTPTEYLTNEARGGKIKQTTKNTKLYEQTL